MFNFQIVITERIFRLNKFENREPYIKKSFINTGTLLIVICSIFLVYLLYRKALTPLIIGGFIAYFLNPFIEAVARRGVKRTWSVAICYIVLILIILLAMLFLIPKLIGQLSEFTEIISEQMPLIEEMGQRYQTFLQKVDPNLRNILESITTQGASRGSEYLKNALSSIMNGAMGMLSQAANLVVGFVIAFYITKDFYDIKQTVVSWIPKNIRENVLLIFSDIDKVFGSFIRGHLTVSFIVWSLSILGLKIIGIRTAFSLGFVVGLLNIIPYFGPILGSIPAVLMALTGGIKPAILTLVVLVVVQQLESGFITPKVVGNSLGLHPLFIIISLLIGGKLFGLAGMILAVPVTGILKALGDRFLMD